MALRLPPLNSLRLFEAAARCGSFKRAAQELKLTPGALSHGINSLEQWLDVELFERNRRSGAVLSRAGKQYLPPVSEALSTIATATLRLPSRRFEERLSITAPSLFTYKLLLPRIRKFREKVPKHGGHGGGEPPDRPTALGSIRCRDPQRSRTMAEAVV
jgi:DNA-binding transcriptional LysR family regulator